jgi:hypothetical protein
VSQQVPQQCHNNSVTSVTISATTTVPQQVSQ